MSHSKSRPAKPSPGANLLLQTPRHQKAQYFPSLPRSKGNYLYYIIMEGQISAFRGGLAFYPRWSPFPPTQLIPLSSILIHFVSVPGK